jgi:DNA-nicking Smr family endonuclease
MKGEARRSIFELIKFCKAKSLDTKVEIMHKKGRSSRIFYIKTHIPERQGS